MKPVLAFLFTLSCFAQYPDLSAFTWVQQEGATLTQTGGRPPVLSFPNTGNKHEKMLLAPLPTPPYTVTLGVSINQTDFSKQVSATLMLRNSMTDKAIVLTDENEMAVTGFNVMCCKVFAGVRLSKTLNVDADSIASTLFVTTGRLPTQRSWTRIVDDGTYRTFFTSQNDGFTWFQEFQEPSGSFTVPDEAGIAGYTLENSSFAGFSLTVWEFSVTSP